MQDIRDLGHVGDTPVVGLLGNDVLADFRTLRVDFEDESVAVGVQPSGGAESTELSIQQVPNGGRWLLTGVTVGDHAVDVVPDTGAELTSFAAVTGEQAGLVASGARRTLSGTHCKIRSHEAKLAGWRAGDIVMPTLQAVLFEPVARPAGVQRVHGTLGLDAMSTFRSVTFDYGRKRLSFER